MAIKVAINGFGRIGRLAFRQMFGEEGYEIVGINDLTDAKTLAHLLKYDSAQGRYGKDVVAKGDSIVVEGKEVKIFEERDPANLPWKELEVDVVLECTGFFRDEAGAGAHITAGAKKVVISAPAQGDIKMVVYGVNHDILDGTENIVSAASCTTNCLAPMAKVMQDEFKIQTGLMTTIHAYTNDQNTLDAPHSDLRRARAAAASIVPNTTGAAVAIGSVIPELDGKLDGAAQRVPVITGSVVELFVNVEKDTTVEEVNAAMKASESEVFGYTEDEIVSTDVIGTTQGSIFDATQTKVMNSGGQQLVKVVAWYDNEYAYTAQMIRVLKHIVELSK